MAALLRHGAARRLGGSVAQRAEAAVAEGRSRLGSRLRHTDELLRHGAARRLGDSVAQRAKAAVADRSSGLGSRLGRTDEEEVVREILQKKKEVLRDVQQKKEELYDLITEGEQNSKTATWANLRLLQHLSREITPRPHDTVWDHVQFGRRFSSVLKTAGLISFAFMVPSCSEYCTAYFDDKEVAPTMMMEEEHEAKITPDVDPSLHVRRSNSEDNILFDGEAALP